MTEHLSPCSLYWINVMDHGVNRKDLAGCCLGSCRVLRDNGRVGQLVIRDIHPTHPSGETQVKREAECEAESCKRSLIDNAIHSITLDI